jgi:hypothetical protein
MVFVACVVMFCDEHLGMVAAAQQQNLGLLVVECCVLATPVSSTMACPDFFTTPTDTNLLA